MLSKTFIAVLTAVATIQALPTVDPNPAGVTYEVLDAFPDGEYVGYTYPNGTVTGHMIDEKGIIKRSIAVHPKEDGLGAAAEVTKRDGGIQRRFVDCWANQFLDRTGTDRAANCLRNRAKQSGGIDLRTPSTSGLYYGCVDSAVRVYYCVNKPNSWGNANLDDINYGLRQMDARCQPYQASYFRWDNTPEIVGKARADTRICLP
ncbi:hypothetical protein V8F33_003215 [Rhypophila sp. PSN 637]